MRKLLAIGLCSMFVLGDAAIYNMQSAQAGVVRRDERAESVLRQARAALGGDAVINAVENLLINGRVNHKIKTPDGQLRSFDGNVEMALETSGKLHKNFKSGDEANLSAEAGKKVVVKQAQVLVERKIESADGAKLHARAARSHGDEFSRLLFGLLLKSSPGLNAVYNYAGEGNVDGAAADIIDASSENGFSVKIYIDKNSHLPLMMTYRAAKPMQIFLKRDAASANAAGAENDVMFFRHGLPEGEKAPGEGATKIIIRKKDENGNVTENLQSGEGLPRVKFEEADFQVRFSDYRSVNGLMLPHHIAQTINGEAGETMLVDSYQINAQNLSEKFKENFTFIRKPAKNSIQ